MNNEKISFNIDEAVDFYFNKKLSAKEKVYTNRYMRRLV